jgi:hypothetical protein
MKQLLEKKRMIVRSNLTLLQEEPYRRFIVIFKKQNVEIVTSLPDYLEAKSDRQRGAGVFQKVVEIMRELNVCGYGMSGTHLFINIVHLLSRLKIGTMKKPNIGIATKKMKINFIYNQREDPIALDIEP